MQTLRPYQKNALSQVRNSWGSGRRAPLLVMPTGAGKTTVLAHLLKSSPKPVLFLCPWRQLVFQALDRFEKNGLSASALMGKKREPTPIHVTTIATAARRDLGQYSLIVIDEAHRALASQCQSILKQFPSAKVLGLTATPVRMDGKALGSTFDDLLEPVSVQGLIDLGFLVPPKVFAPQEVNFAGLRYDSRKRDFSSKSVGEVFGKPRLLGDALEHYRRFCWKQPAFVYTANKEHAEHVKGVFEAGGVSCGYIDGATSQTARMEELAKLDTGESNVIINIGCLTEGVDYPPLRAMILLRPTLSTGLHLQIVGRGLRPHPGKSHCVVLDHAGNFLRHGFPQQDRKWSLRGRRKQQIPSSSSGPQAKPCPSCGALISPSSSRCSHCGTVILPGTAPGKLQQLEPESVRLDARRW